MSPHRFHFPGNQTSPGVPKSRESCKVLCFYKLLRLEQLFYSVNTGCTDLEDKVACVRWKKLTSRSPDSILTRKLRQIYSPGHMPDQVLVTEPLWSPSHRCHRDALQRDDFGAHRLLLHAVGPHPHTSCHKRPTPLLSFVPNIPRHYALLT